MFNGSYKVEEKDQNSNRSTLNYPKKQLLSVISTLFILAAIPITVIAIITARGGDSQASGVKSQKLVQTNKSKPPKIQLKSVSSKKKNIKVFNMPDVKNITETKPSKNTQLSTVNKQIKSLIESGDISSLELKKLAKTRKTMILNDLRNGNVSSFFDNSLAANKISLVDDDLKGEFEKNTTVKGKLTSVWYDSKKGSKNPSQHVYQIVVSDKERYDVLFKENKPVTKDNVWVTVSGKKIGNYIMVEDKKNFQQKVLGASFPPTTQGSYANGNDYNRFYGDQKVLVVPIDFHGYTDTSLTKSQILDYYNFIYGIGEYYRQNTNNQLILTSTVTDFVLANDMTDGDYVKKARALAAQIDSRVDYSQYKFIQFLVPPSSNFMLGFGGYAFDFELTTGEGNVHLWATTVGLWFDDLVGITGIAAHEIGHNLGSGHSGALDCVVGSISDTCGALGDYYFDVMGAGGLIFMNSHRKDKTGWFNPGQVQTISSAGDYLLNNYGTISDDVKVYKIPNARGFADRYYYLEFRQTYSRFKDINSADSLSGITIHYSIPSTQVYNSSGFDTFLVDTSPGTYNGEQDFQDAPLQIGQVFHDPVTKLNIEPYLLSYTNSYSRILDQLHFRLYYGDPNPPSSVSPPDTSTGLSEPFNLYSQVPTCSNDYYSATFNWETNGANRSDFYLMKDGEQIYYNKIYSNAGSGHISWYQNMINLAPGERYEWRVLSINDTNGYRSLASGEITSVMVNPCSPSPPYNLVSAGVPSCSDNLYSGVKTSFDSKFSSKAELELYGNGQLVSQTFSWDLNYGGSYNLWVDWTSLSPGVEYTWRARTYNQAGWSNWINGPSFKVEKCPFVDLWPDTITAKDGTNALPGGYPPGGSYPVYYSLVGRQLNLSSKVNNTGNLISGAFTTKWYVNGSLIKSASHTSIGAQTYESAGHDTATYTPATKGNYTIKLCAETSVVEQNKNNNCIERLIIVDYDIPSDLFIKNCEGVVNEICLYNSHGKKMNYFVAGETVTAKFKAVSQYKLVHNFKIGLWFGKSFTSTPKCNTVPQVSLDIGALIATETNLEMKFKIPDSFGTGAMIGYILIDSSGSSNSYCAINEVKENNNLTPLLTQVYEISGDLDKDGYTNKVEAFIGTSVVSKCTGDGWPPDVNNDGVANLSDITLFGNHFNTLAGQEKYNIRFDLNADNRVNLSDITLLGKDFNTRCQ